MKLFLLLVAALCCATSSWAAVPLEFRNPTPSSVELHWSLNVPVAGLQLRLGNRANFDFVDVKKGPAAPGDWSLSHNLAKDKGTVVFFAFSGSTAVGPTNNGKLMDIFFQPTLGQVEIDSCSMSGSQGAGVECTPPAPVQIPQPALGFTVSDISTEHVTLSYSLSGWDKVTSMQFEVEGMLMSSATSSLGFTCANTGTGMQMVCSASNIPAATNAELIRFDILENSGGRSFKMINTQFAAERPQLTFDATLPAVAYVPKISVGIDSIESVDNSVDTCIGSSETCIKKKMEVTLKYYNHDTTVLIAGFEFTLTGDVVWIGGDVAEGIHGFNVTPNYRGKFVGFSMEGAQMPASAAEGSVLFVGHFENKLTDTVMTMEGLTLSDNVGVSIENIVLNGGSATIPGCDLDNDGYCDTEDEDCDCCLNDVDGVPDDPNAGCGFCSDLDDNKDIDIVDVVRTVNMLAGVDKEQMNVLKGDGNGDKTVNVQDVLLAVSLSLEPPAVMENRPCGL